jgi:DNA ligase-associated metallophosphoesterase
MQTQVAGVPLRLLAQRAAYLPETGLLLVADLHLGKAQSFRRLGVPVPSGTTAAALARLDQCIAQTGARGIVFLGDLIHAARSSSPATWAAVAEWRARHAGLALTLVRGNHDRHAGDPPPEWRIEAVEEPWRPWLGSPLALCHHPEPVACAYVLAGHVHPAVWLGGRAHDSLRLPCFHFGPAVGLLPAFGGFTGSHAVDRMPGDRVFVVHPEGVAALP